jgi:hypothetical protein
MGVLRLRIGEKWEGGGWFSRDEVSFHGYGRGMHIPTAADYAMVWRSGSSEEYFFITLHQAFGSLSQSRHYNAVAATEALIQRLFGHLCTLHPRLS